MAPHLDRILGQATNQDRTIIIRDPLRQVPLMPRIMFTKTVLGKHRMGTLDNLIKQEVMSMKHSILSQATSGPTRRAM